MEAERQYANLLFAVIAMIVSAFFPVAARAQILPPADSVKFSRYTSVNERQIEGFEPRGLSIGTFTMFPQIDVNGGFTDNLFALQNNGKSAPFVAVSPQITLQSDWKKQSLSLNATGEFDRYQHYSTENVNSATLSLHGTRMLGKEFQIRTTGKFETNQESRESEDSVSFTINPIRYKDYSSAIGLSKRARHFMIDSELGIRQFYYENAELVAGGILDQRYRNQTTFSARGRIDYIATPATAYYVQITHLKSSYPERDVFGVRRGSATNEALAGIRFELPVLIRGELGLGYLSSVYKDRGLARYSGLAIHANVVLFPTQLSNITLNVSRSVNSSSTAQSSSYISLVGGIRVDHELLRSIRLGASMQIESDTFNGEDRRDRRVDIAADATYRMNRTIWLKATYSRLDLSSTGTARYKSFIRNRMMIGIGLRV